MGPSTHSTRQQATRNRGEIAMSKVNSRIITFATIILWLGFAATNATSAFANEGRSQLALRGAVRHHARY
jgi:hypothetical protein